MRTRRLFLVLTSLVLALAVWVSRGTIGVADASAWPARLGVLPTRWAPAVLLIVIAAALVRARRATLLALLAPAVLLLPWLPVPVPAAALAWTGQLVWWVWVATAVAAATVAWPARWNAHPIVRTVRDPLTAPLVAFVVAFVLYAGGAWLLRDSLPSGDEPHYLVITQSLLADGDLQIENNHQRGDYHAYYRGDLRPDFLRRGKNGQVYSIHAPGISALVLPAFAAGGYRGVAIFLALLSAVGAWLVWRAGYRLTGSVGAAWFGWSAVAMSVPFFFHAFRVYPDAVGAVIVVTAVTALLACEPDANGAGPSAAVAWGAGRWALHGVALAVLPWLHTRFAGAAAVLGICLGLRLIGQRAFRRLAALWVPPVVSLTAWLGFYYAIYGEFSPAAPYGHSSPSQWANIPRALPALLFDQQFGVLANAPVYLLALAGFVPLFRARKRLAVELGAVFAIHVLLVAAFHMWWAGWSAPAQFTVPVLLMLALPAAAFWAGSRAAGKAVATSALVVSLLITATMTLVESGSLVFNDRDGVARWLAWLTPVIDASRALPSFFRDPTGTALLHGAIWIACLGLGAATLRTVARLAGRTSGDDREADAAGAVDAGAARTRGALAMAAPLAFGLAIMLAGEATWKTSGVAGATPTPSALAVLRDFDPAARPVGVQFRPFARVQIDGLPSRLTLRASPPGSRPHEGGSAVPDGPMLMLEDVPAGLYRLSPGATRAAKGTVEVSIGRGDRAIDRWVFDPASPSPDGLIALPVTVNSVNLTGDAEARQSMPGLALEPVAIAPQVWRFTIPRAARAARYGGLVAFSFDLEADLEEPGIWVHGGVPVMLAFAGPAGAPAIRLMVRNCPVENRVTLRGNARSEAWSLKPGEERVLELPVDQRNGGAFVEITSENGYRPADVDRASQDLRYLGVWVQPAPARGMQ
jgi:hypothetical protein